MLNWGIHFIKCRILIPSSDGLGIITSNRPRCRKSRGQVPIRNCQDPPRCLSLSPVDSGNKPLKVLYGNHGNHGITYMIHMILWNPTTEPSPPKKKEKNTHTQSTAYNHWSPPPWLTLDTFQVRPITRPISWGIGISWRLIPSGSPWQGALTPAG